MDKKVTYSVVNGTLVRRTIIQIETFPEIEHQVRSMVRVLEEIYELAFERGLAQRSQIHDMVGKDEKQKRMADSSTE